MHPSPDRTVTPDGRSSKGRRTLRAEAARPSNGRRTRFVLARLCSDGTWRRKAPFAFFFVRPSVGSPSRQLLHDLLVSCSTRCREDVSRSLRKVFRSESDIVNSLLRPGDFFRGDFEKTRVMFTSPTGGTLVMSPNGPVITGVNAANDSSAEMRVCQQQENKCSGEVLRSQCFDADFR